MSDFSGYAYRPGSSVPEPAEFLDDYYGPHVYGVRFADGAVFPAEECAQAAVEHFEKAAKEEGKPRLRSVSWRQEPHCCATRGTEPVFDIRVEDGGGGEYLVIEASEWALDTLPGESIADAIKRIGRLLGCE